MLNLDTAIIPGFTKTILQGMNEIIGPQDLSSALEQAGIGRVNPDESVSLLTMDGLHDAITGLFGERAGQGVMLRSGRASFKYFLNEFGQSLGLNTLEYRFLSNQQRLRVGFEKLAQFFSDNCEIKVRIDQDDRCWYWKMMASQAGVGCKSEEIFCQFSIGFLQDFLTWCGNGHNYRVSEARRPENGDSYYLIRIEKLPAE